MAATTRRTPSPDDRLFGRHVRSCRRARGLTQEALADRSTLSADTIRRLEHGSFSPSLDTLRKLCTGLSLQLSTLFLAIELGEREVRQELIDAIGLMNEHEQAVLLRLVHTIRALLRGGTEDDEP